MSAFKWWISQFQITMPHIAVCISTFRDHVGCYFSAQEGPSFHNRLYRYLAVLIDIHTTYWLDENLYK